jgi:hypothetical protein
LEDDCRADGLHGATEGRKETIPHSVDDISGVLLDSLASDLMEFSQQAQSLGFALLHQAAIAYHIAENDRCEPPLAQGDVVRQFLQLRSCSVHPSGGRVLDSGAPAPVGYYAGARGIEV